MATFQTLKDQLAGHVKHGDHLCVICDDPRDRIEAAAQYVADGIRQNEFVMYAADPDTTRAIRQELERLGVEVDAAIARGALSFPTAYEAYLRGGNFDPDDMYQTFERAIEQALADGYTGCRFAGEPIWAIDRASLRPGLIAFEARLNQLFAHRKAAGLCVYDRRSWPAEVVRDVLRTHPIAVVGDLVCKTNVYYQREHLDDPESQVAWMLTRLRELRTQEARLQIALEAGRLGNWELDLQTDTATRSLRHDQIFGYERPVPVWGYDVFMRHVLPEDRERVDTAFRHALQHRTTWHFECRIQRVDGAIRWIEAFGRPDPDGVPGGKVERLLGIVADITERKELEQALREADRRKDEFLATLAHELRNPLAPILNAVELLRRDGPPDPRLRRARETIGRQARHLVRLVDDLLEVSRISTGRIHLQRQRIELRTALASAIEASQPVIQAAQNTFATTIPGEPMYVDGDPTRLAQVFLNLLNNAAKYTPSGGRIELVARCEPDAIVVSIRDNGVGFRPERLPEMFTLFGRGHDPAEHARSGLGIGLPLTKQLLELHGGSIEARSEGPGQGSEFVVRLPRSAPPEPEVEAPAAERGEGAPRWRVLVVDDNVDAADSLAANLEVLGHEVHVRYDGQGALEAAAAVAPDVIVLDIGLPDLDGYEVARRLRAATERDVTLVALTGWGQERDRRLAREAGFDLHRTKPIDAGELVDAITAVALPGHVVIRSEA